MLPIDSENSKGFCMRISHEAGKVRGRESPAHTRLPPNDWLNGIAEEMRSWLNRR